MIHHSLLPLLILLLDEIKTKEQLQLIKKVVNFYGVLNLALLKQIKKCSAVKGERKKRNLTN